MNELPSAAVRADAIDQVCDAFEQSWSTGQRPRIEDYLDRVEGPLRSQLWGELLLAELECRRRCGEAPTLQEYLQRFPDRQETLAQFFRDATMPGGGKTDPPPLPAGPGQQVGGYELLQEIARGGMGVVYRARQVSLNRVVALKMILAGAHADPEQRSRFRLEAEAVARLQHPHIVQVHEVGEAGGLPFLAMELVDGPSLSQWLADRRDRGSVGLAPGDAAALVELLARAVQHAHERGVVHRDLKPANVLLVTGEEKNTRSITATHHPPRAITPKVTDFGLAKFLDGAGERTRTGALVGTPSHMAPEQTGERRGEIGPATDVYALGGIFYELLTGRPPFQGATVLETLELVRATEPVPPSQLQPRLPRDLETVCLKCLRKEPQRRYASALELADDLGRFLAGKPVQARPVSQAERLWRWCRRKPAVAGLLATLTLVLVGSLVLVTGLWLRAEGLRQLAVDKQGEAEANLNEAEANFDLARAAVDELFIAASEDPLLQRQGLQPVRAALLRPTLKYYQNFLDKRRDDPRLREELARNYHRVGAINNLIGSKQDALAAFAEARQIREELVQAHPAARPHQNDLAATCLAIGGLHRVLGNVPAALEAYDRARDLQEQVVAADRDAAPARLLLADCYKHLGLLRNAGGNSAAAIQFYNQALGLLEELVQTHPGVARYQNQLSQVYNNLGLAQHDSRAFAAALRSHEQAGAIMSGLVQAHPDNVEYQGLLAGGAYNKGRSQQRNGDTAGALRTYEQARDRLQPLVQANPAVTEYQLLLARSHNNIGNLQRVNRAFDAAMRSHQEALRLLDKLVRLDGQALPYQNDLVHTHLNLGRLHLRTDANPEALKSFEQAHAIQQKLVQTDPTVVLYQKDLLAICREIGRIRRQSGDHDASRTYYEQARGLLDKLIQVQPEVVAHRRDLADTYYQLGLVEHSAARRDAARHYYKQARGLYEELLRANDTDTPSRAGLAPVLINLAMLQVAEEDYRGALPLLDQARVLREVLVEEQPGNRVHRGDLANTWSQIGTMHRLLGERTAGLRALEQARDLAESVVKEEPTNPRYREGLAQALIDLAEAQVGTDQVQAALQSGERAGGLLDQLVKEGPDRLQIRFALGRAWNLVGRILAKLDQNEKVPEACLKGQAHLRFVVNKVPEREDYRTHLGNNFRQLSAAYRQLGRRGDAAAAAQEYQKLWPKDGDHLYQVACALAECASLAGGGQPAADEPQRRRLEDQSLEVLRQAVANGFNNLQLLKEEKALEPLRSREGFQKLLAELEERAKTGGGR